MFSIGFGVFPGLLYFVCCYMFNLRVFFFVISISLSPVSCSWSEAQVTLMPMALSLTLPQVPFYGNEFRGRDSGYFA